ncbi:MAG: acyl-CoA dehydrogenase family protein, partial [Acidimicrobiia bacterium]|nr:acyl-CoA dehydrogenase family protein [Acidimicrobiia bacterium]
MSDAPIESAELAAFRAEARAWLDAHAERRTGVDDWSTQRHHVDQAAMRHYFERCRAWQRTLFDGGWAGISWPAEYGGRSGTSEQARVFKEEMAAFDVTSGFLDATITMLGAALRFCGREEQKRHFLPRLLSAEDTWCQLFSEPGAGSDLAGLAARAVRDGDHFVVTGQKVWNSMAQFADWGFLIVRTNPDVPKHQGITFLLVDMASSGVEVRPLVQANGAGHFNEVFLEEVRVPVANVVGEIDGGWAPTRVVMMAESQFIGGGGGEPATPRLVALARRRGVDADPRIRQELARCHTREQLLRLMSDAMMSAVRRGEDPPVSGAVLKLFTAETRVAIGNLATGLLGPAATADTDPDSEWAQLALINRFSVSI